MKTHLWQVTSPDFCAGLITRGGRVIDAAPVLLWSIGMNSAYFRRYFSRKGWTVAYVSTD